jgi:hypothetical protein
MNNRNIYIYFLTFESFFTDVAVEIKKRDCDFEISGLSTTSINYFNNFKYNKISFLSDIKYKKTKVDYNYLQKIEKEFNFNISELIHLERYSYKLTHEEKLCYVEGFIKKIISDYDFLKFNLILSGGLCDGISYFLYLFAKKKKIQFYYHIPNRLGSDYYLSDHPDSGPIDFLQKFDNNILLYEKDKTKFNHFIQKINNYVLNKSQPDYLKDNTLVFKYFSINDIKTIINIIFRRNIKIFHGEANLLKLIKQRFNKLKQNYIYKLIVKNDSNFEKEYKSLKYFIFPLQFHPESATIVLGKWLHNQVEIIKMISRVLPVEVILVVKEHPHSVGRRQVNFYYEISQLHNIKFINSAFPVTDLLASSLGVITISSTMGLEAILINKPVILFGDIHYAYLKGVIKVSNFKKIDIYLEEALKFDKYEDDQVWPFLKTIMEKTMPLIAFSPYNYNSIHVDSYVNFLFNELKDNNFEQ